MAHSVEVFEINGDNLPDVLGAAYGANDIAYWQNMGGNPIVWEKQVIDDSYPGPLKVCSADIDSDGDVDVAATAGIGAQVAWWSNEGGNPVQWEKHLVASNFYDAWPICLADLDNDGDIDVVAGSSSLDEIRWWENLLITSVDDNSESSVPVEFELYNNFPNPFNPVTNIKYQVPELSFITLKIYDVLGKEITTLVYEEKPVGEFELKFDGTELTSGIYFYQLSAGLFRQTKKMILLE